MARCGYVQIDRVSMNFRATLNPEYFAQHAMSYCSAFAALSRRGAEFTNAMTNAMRKYAIKGSVDAVCNSSANIYRVA